MKNGDLIGIDQEYIVMPKTLRDEFAMAALQGETSRTGFKDYDGPGPVEMAVACYKLADAMMEARK